MMRRRGLLFALPLLALRPAVAGVTAAELARIERLIQFVEGQKDLKFVRNGTAYDCKDAAEFMRGKFKMMGEHVTTAQGFIDQIASKSTTTGLPYLILFADGKTIHAAKFLGDELKRMDHK
jgi:hypothetical protein